MYYDSHLYEKIFRKHAKAANSLNIISGYASVNMLEQLHYEFPKLIINLYIGMALEGIPYEEHIKYESLMQKNPNINIYYKIKYPITHIKLYDFKFDDGDSMKYIGSANFSEAGLKYNHEILIETTIDYSDLFREVHEGSLSCTDFDIENYITFFEEETELLPNTGNSNSEDKYLVKERNSDPIYSNGKSNYIPYRKKMIRKSSRATEADFRIPIILESDYLPENRGINAWVRGNQPYLKQSNSYPFSLYFPLKGEFKIITDKGEEFLGILNERNDNHLIIYPSIYEYLRNRLKITKRRPIDLRDLKKQNMVEVWGDKIEDDIYFFDFSPKGVDRR